MRVLLISHTCQSITEGQPKAHALAALGDVTLRVLVPDRWHRYGQWRTAQPPASAEFEYQIAKIRWPWIGPAQTYLHHYPCLATVLREFRPDVIDLWEEPWSMVSAQACKLRRRILPEAKIVSETEQNIEKELPFPFERFRASTLAAADFVVARNSEALEVTRRKGFKGPAQTVPNAVDAELFRPMDRESCRRQLGLSGFVVGYVGRLVQDKGVLDLLHAVRLCPPDVNMVVVGDGPLRAQLAALSDRIRVIPAMPLAELPPLMNALDVLVLPSQTSHTWKEQFGRVIIEAHACATPVIGSNSGAIPEVIGGGGLIVPERNPPGLASAIVQLRDDAQRRRALGEIGRRQVLDNFTWDRVARQMRDIYLRVLAPADQPVAT